MGQVEIRVDEMDAGRITMSHVGPGMTHGRSTCWWCLHATDPDVLPCVNATIEQQESRTDCRLSPDGLSFEIASVICGGDGPHGCIYPVTRLDNRDNRKTPCQWYQDALLDCTADVLIYIHDDVSLHDFDWAGRVMQEFTDPDVVCVGLGGATRLGQPDLYKRQYRLEDMARGGYCSNQTDHNTHGQHLTGSMCVAVVDAFFMAIRTDFLRGIGGWPVTSLSHHCQDLWLACEAVRAGKRTRAVGVSCTHHGGGSSTKPVYRDAKWLQGESLERDHQAPHEWLYREYRDVLPIVVEAE